jgi:hypothetical protein
MESRLMPEEELQTKQAELDDLLDRLAQNELETLHAETNSFFSTYNDAGVHKVGEANELRAHIAQAINALDSTDITRSESQEAQSSADQPGGGSPRNIIKITTYITSINGWRVGALEQQSRFNESLEGGFPAIEITALEEPGNRIGRR